ncbi:MAG: hypothetical protein PHG19_08295 [Anaerotignum sp.]|nr:hypothetical protein [Anaerotignum sp.]
MELKNLVDIKISNCFSLQFKKRRGNRGEKQLDIDKVNDFFTILKQALSTQFINLLFRLKMGVSLDMKHLAEFQFHSVN